MLMNRWAKLGAALLVLVLVLCYHHRSLPDLHAQGVPRPVPADVLNPVPPYVRVLGELGDLRAVMRCHHCALVTSSGQLLGSDAGEEIDRTECVIRMNDAPTVGYERGVGMRTTLRVLRGSGIGTFVARTSAELLDERRVPAQVLFWGKKQSFWSGVQDPWIRSFCSRNDGSCFRISPSANPNPSQLFRNEMGLDRTSQKMPSTGFFAMLMAVESCDDVTVYGMVPANHCTTMTMPGAPSTPYHYYEDLLGPSECEFYLKNKAHRFITEKEVFARWAQTYNITFAHPAW